VVLAKNDTLRRDKELKDIEQHGYFTMKDGKKSSDVEVP